jgi:hypothetical protein
MREEIFHEVSDLAMGAGDEVAVGVEGEGNRGMP